MTTELEKQFFDTFEIEHCGYKDPEAQLRYKCGLSYPIKKACYEITDKQYLELICISNKELIKRFDVNGSDLESIKSNILSKCIKDYTFYSNTLCETYNRLAENFKHQVQAIFEGKN